MIIASIDDDVDKVDDSLLLLLLPLSVFVVKVYPNDFSDAYQFGYANKMKYIKE